MPRPFFTIMIPEIVLLAAFTSPPAASPSATAEKLSVSLRVLEARPLSEPGVTFAIEVCNKGAQRLALTLPSAQIHDIVVSRKGHEVWRWSRGRLFAAVLTPFSLAPGRCKESRILWKTDRAKLRDSEGRAIEPGTYEAVAILTTAPEIRSKSVPFEILPAKK